MVLQSISLLFRSGERDYVMEGVHENVLQISSFCGPLPLANWIFRFLTSHMQRRARLCDGRRARELPPHAVPRGDDAEDGGVPPLDGRLGARQPPGALPPKLLSHG